MFIEEIIKDINDNEILYPQSLYFVPKKHLVEELNRKKVQKGLNENQAKLESLRFSSEISYLAEFLS